MGSVSLEALTETAVDFAVVTALILADIAAVELAAARTGISVASIASGYNAVIRPRHTVALMVIVETGAIEGGVTLGRLACGRSFK